MKIGVTLAFDSQSPLSEFNRREITHFENDDLNRTEILVLQTTVPNFKFSHIIIKRGIKEVAGVVFSSSNPFCTYFYVIVFRPTVSSCSRPIHMMDIH